MRKQSDRLFAIHEAIWIRDNAELIRKEALIEKAKDLANYDLFSNRQISKISGGVLSHVAVSANIPKANKKGGRFSPQSLEDIATVLFSVSNGGPVDFDAVRRAMKSGTSQGMISRLTGLSQSRISREAGFKNS
jgi:hypothetical protein